MSFNSFSQADTTGVILSKDIARLVIKDIVSGDYCEAELTETRNALLLTEKKAELQDQAISNIERQTYLLREVMVQKDTQINSQEQIIKDVEKMHKKQKNLTVLYKIGTIAGAVLSGYLLLK